jgi:hypothetical protein
MTEVMMMFSTTKSMRGGDRVVNSFIAVKNGKEKLK